MKSQYSIVAPLAKQIFSSIKTTGIFGYRAERDTLEYLDAIEEIVRAVSTKGVNLLPNDKGAKLQLIHEIAKQTKRCVVPKISCLSREYYTSFYRAEVTPAKMKAKAQEIAEACSKALSDFSDLIVTRSAVAGESDKTAEFEEEKSFEITRRQKWE